MHHLLEQKIKEHLFSKPGAGLMINVNRLYCFILVVPKAWKTGSILEKLEIRYAFMNISTVVNLLPTCQIRKNLSSLMSKIGIMSQK